LWVNGSDAAFWEHQSLALEASRRQYTWHDIAARWADHGELRFSPRSVERHAPWVGQIHIVTGNQFSITFPASF
jgi:hypothetical protein